MTDTKEQNKLDLEQFIKDNKLNFNQTGSGLNGVCVVLSGYACYLGIEDFKDVNEVVLEMFPDAVYYDELERVFNYAYNNNYGYYWKLDEAKKIYKF